MEEIARPEPGQERNGGAVTVPRPAATVIVVRGGATGLEVLLVQRTHEARFMSGVWVFPGGALDAGETEEQAALRELEEEAGITLADPSALVRFSRWITPAEVRTRYDTHFFLAPVDDDVEPAIDDNEIIDSGWFEPRAALDAHVAGELLIVFPTIKSLERLAGFQTADELLSHSRGRDVQPVLPRVILTGETAHIVLLGEPGYEET